MGIFESLENLNVSESCIDDILEIAEAMLQREEGESESEWKQRLANKHIPKIKAERRHLDKTATKQEQKQKRLNKERDEISKEVGAKSSTFLKAADKTEKALQNYEEVPSGSDAKDDLYKKYRRAYKKSSNAYGAWKSLVDQRGAIDQERDQNSKSAKQNIERRNKLNNTVAKLKGKYWKSKDRI